MFWQIYEIYRMRKFVAFEYIKCDQIETATHLQSIAFLFMGHSASDGWQVLTNHTPSPATISSYTDRHTNQR